MQRFDVGVRARMDVSAAARGKRPHPVMTATGSDGGLVIGEAVLAPATLGSPGVVRRRGGESWHARAPARSTANGSHGCWSARRLARRSAARRRRACTSAPACRWSAASAPPTSCASPWPIYLERGQGSRVWDVDGNELIDLHNGFGSMVQGHAHPAINRAVSERVSLGTHFAAPTEDGIVVANELARRFRPRPLALHELRLGVHHGRDPDRARRTGRDTVVKMFGSYHGHHDTVMVSIGVEYAGSIGPRDDYRSLPYGAGIPQAVVDMTVAVPFNDIEAMERRIARLEAEGRLPACVIMEATLLNLGVVPPEPGYLEAVRELTRRKGIVLIFDEVKTGLCIAAGGAVERFGVTPDMVTLAKALGGGLPSGAIGGTEDVMSPSRTAASARSAPTTATRSRWWPPGRTCSRC